jgi:hypothetical protein
VLFKHAPALQRAQKKATVITDSSRAIQSLPIFHDFSLPAGKRHLCSTLKTWFFITHTRSDLLGSPVFFRVHTCLAYAVWRQPYRLRTTGVMRRKLSSGNQSNRIWALLGPSDSSARVSGTAGAHEILHRNTVNSDVLTPLQLLIGISRYT